MYRNSSTSSFSYVRYLCIAMLAVVGLCALVVVLGYLARRHHFRHPDELLYAYQTAKLAQARDADTLFLGDSSLGNAINAKLWSTLSGAKTLNLALTGGYGYEGAYVLLLESIAAGLRPKRIIIFFEPQQMTGNISYTALLRAHLERVPLGDRLWLYWRMHMNIQAVWESAQSLMPGRRSSAPKLTVAQDYIEQSPVARDATRFNASSSVRKPINPKKLGYLEKIHAVCQAQAIRCLYVHGPVTGKDCAQEDFFAEMQARLVQIGFTVVSPTPLCVPAQDIGDSPNHLHPQVKDSYTRKYFQLVAPWF